MLLTAAAVVVVFLVLLPFLSWWSHVYTITTRRVLERWGVFGVRRRELSHVRGYTVQERRGSSSGCGAPERSRCPTGSMSRCG